MFWKIIDIKTWNPGLEIGPEQCREMFGEEVAAMKGPKIRFFYDGEDLLEVTGRIFSEWAGRFDFPSGQVKDMIVGASFLPDPWNQRKPGLASVLTNSLNLKSGEPFSIVDRACTTIPSALEYLDNKRLAGRRNLNDFAVVAVYDFPSISLRKKLIHHKTSLNIFGDGCFFMLLKLVDKPHDFAPGYAVEAIENIFLPDTADKAHADNDGAILLTHYMTDVVPDLVYRDGVKPVLGRYKLTTHDFRYWIVHPGGVPIISGVERNLGLPKRSLQYVYDTFFEGGNRWAASAGYVFDRVHRTLPKKDGDRFFMATAAIGIYLGAVIMTYFE